MRNTRKRESDNKSQISPSSDNCKTRKSVKFVSGEFDLTANNQYILKKGFYDLLLRTAKTLEHKVFFQLAWQTAGRNTELVSIKTEWLKGNMLTMINAKNHKVCLNCDSKKKKHTKTFKCKNYQPDMTPRYKTQYITDELVILIKAYILTHNKALIIPRTTKHLRNICKKYHENLTPKSFRSGFATFLLNQGVDKETIAVMLGHDDLRTVSKHYLPRPTAKGHAIIQKIHEGTSIKKLSDYTMEELLTALKDTIVVSQ